MKKEKRNKTRLQIVNKQYSVLNLLFSFLFSLFFLSCRSTPIHFNTILEQTHLPLDIGASIYLIADVKNARSIIELLPVEELNYGEAKQMLDRTDFAVAALFPFSSGKRFQLASYGSYPNSRVRMALNSNKHWEKYTAESGESYWYAELSRLSIAVTPNRAFAMSFLKKDLHRNPRAEDAGVEIPEGFIDFIRTRAELSCWIDGSENLISEIMGKFNIPVRMPVQQVFINFFQMPENEYEVIIRMLFANANMARGAVNMLNLAAGFVPADFKPAQIFFANPPALNGSAIDIKTARLKEEDLKFLLDLLF